MFVNNINPVLLSFGPLEIRWYGIIIVFGFVIYYFYFKYLAKTKQVDFTFDELVDVLLWGAIGTFVTSRLFYVVFYNFPFYIQDPLKIFAIWEGGLSFHGGLIGAFVSGYIYCRIKKKDYLQLADISTIPAAFALFLGRIANFINSELVGTVTNMSWGVNFNGELDVEGNPIFRHPSQLYESAKNVVMLTVLWIVKEKGMKKGTLFSLFILMYSGLRFFIGFWRAPDLQIGYLAFGLTLGQYINIVMFVVGIGLLIWVHKRKDDSVALVNETVHEEEKKDTEGKEQELNQDSQNNT